MRIAEALRAATHARVDLFSAQLGLSPRQTERLCQEAFGRTPKRLLDEQRLLRTLKAQTSPGESRPVLRIDLSYSDHAHFCRDCRRLSGHSLTALLSQGLIDQVVSRLEAGLT